MKSRVFVALLVSVCLAGCTAVGVDPVGMPLRPSQAAHQLTVVSWNAQKGSDPRFTRDLQSLLRAETPDLVFLQEARAELAEGVGLPGLFARSWSYPWPGGKTVGVLTLSRSPALRARPVRSPSREFGWTAPKMSLVSEHRLPGGRSLLAANVHLLNFERFGTRQLDGQLEGLIGRLAAHEGPIVIAGDFNAWSPARLARVAELASGLGLQEVQGFGLGRRTGDLGQGWANRLLGVDPSLALDRVYYRELVLLGAKVLDYRSSDHAPLSVTFGLEAPRS